MHSDLGGLLIEVNSIKDLAPLGCEGQNETSVHGGGKWVSVSQMVAHKYGSGLGFWSTQY